MSRYVDSLPTPHHVKEKKLIVLSAPRSGTQGLYFALQELGFKPYHMTELVGKGGSHVRMMLDAYDGEIGEGKQYTRADFDKWFADYDIIIEMPFMMLSSTLKAYPDAKYLLVERDPESWARSVENTIFKTGGIMTSWPMLFFSLLSPGLRNMREFSLKFRRRITKGWGSGHEGEGGSEGEEERKKGHENMVETYRNYVEEIKRKVAPERLQVVRLEDGGYGWDFICEYLGVEAPAKGHPWPRKNTTEEFMQMAGPHIERARNVTVVGAVAIAALGLGVGWGFAKGRIPMPFFVKLSFGWRK